MLFDALSANDSGALVAGAERSDNERGAVITLANHTRVVYMAANQLPLLGLGRVTSEPIAIENNCDRLAFVYCRAARAVGDAPLQVIGFFDPDDLLGYRADGGIATQDSNVQFINVRHRNADQWLWLLTWPTAAHDQELNRESSRRLIFCGGTADANGRLHPNMEGCRGTR